jgi:hypothetical protein
MNSTSIPVACAVILILKVSVDGNRDERNQVVNPITIRAATELKISSQPLFHSRLQTLNAIEFFAMLLCLKGATSAIEKRSMY